jgi:hypothetical protein
MTSVPGMVLYKVDIFCCKQKKIVITLTLDELGLDVALQWLLILWWSEKQNDLHTMAQFDIGSYR